VNIPPLKCAVEEEEKVAEMKEKKTIIKLKFVPNPSLH
jgi:hypothetical protein